MQLSQDQWICLHDARFICGIPDTMPNMLECLIGILARYPAVFRRFITVLIEMTLLWIQSSEKMGNIKKVIITPCLQFYGVVLDGSCSWHHWFVGISYKSTNYNMIPSWWPISLHDNSALFIPIICNLVAMGSFWQTLRLLSTKWKLFPPKKHKT